MRRSLLPFLVAFLLATAIAPSAAEVAIPPHGDRSVHDLAGVLEADAVATMERWNRELFRATGVAIVVVTVSDLEGEAIDDFALRVAEAWKVGRAGEDRGIVLALSSGDRRVFIATGYGVEGYLPDGRVGRLLDEQAVPSLRSGDYSTAMLRTDQALVALSAAEYGVTLDGVAPPAGMRDRRGRRSGPLGTVMGVLFLLFMAYLAIRHPRLFLLMMISGMGRRGGRGGGGFGGGSGFGGFGGGGFGGGGAGRGF